MRMTTVYRCKLHNYEHAYTVCPDCRHQFCREHWGTCPSCAQFGKGWRERLLNTAAGKARAAIAKARG